MKTRVILFVSFVILLLCGSVLFGQSKYLEKPSYADPADLLIWLKVDTNDIESLRSSIHSSNWGLSCEVSIFLAERGYSDILPMVKSKYDSAMAVFPSGEYGLASYIGSYLVSLYLLHDPDLIAEAKAFIDTVLSNFDIKDRYWYQHDLSETMSLLATAGDYTQFNNLKMLVQLDLKDTVQFHRNPDHKSWSETNFTLLTAYGERPEYRATVFNLLKEFAFHPKEDCRSKAESCLSWYFRDIPETREVVIKIAQSDPDFELRERAILDLWNLFKDPIAIDIYRGIILTSTDSVQVKEAAIHLAYLNSPFAYAALLSCYEQRKQDPLGNIIKEEINYYWAPVLQPDVPLTVAIDSLRAYTIECQNLKWIGGREFVKELTNHLAHARKHLDRKDSLNSSRKIEKYQSEIDREYREGNNRDNRFVTAAGWKYLYMEARYVIARLITPPHKSYAPLLEQIDSLRSELKRQEDSKNVSGLLLTKSLELFVNQADGQLQRGDSMGTGLNLTLFQLLVDQTNELTGDLKTKRHPPFYVSDRAYIQLYYLAKYILEDLPRPRESIELSGRIDKELQQELEKMKSGAIGK